MYQLATLIDVMIANVKATFGSIITHLMAIFCDSLYTFSQFHLGTFFLLLFDIFQFPTVSLSPTEDQPEASHFFLFLFLPKGSTAHKVINFLCSPSCGPLNYSGTNPLHTAPGPQTRLCKLSLHHVGISSENTTGKKREISVFFYQNVTFPLKTSAKAKWKGGVPAEGRVKRNPRNCSTISLSRIMFFSLKK